MKNYKSSAITCLIASICWLIASIINFVLLNNKYVTIIYAVLFIAYAIKSYTHFKLHKKQQLNQDN